jgi:hypothetical protein
MESIGNESLWKRQCVRDGEQEPIRMAGIYAHELKKGPWILFRRQSNESDQYRPGHKKGGGIPT